MSVWNKETSAMVAGAPTQRAATSARVGLTLKLHLTGQGV